MSFSRKVSFKRSESIHIKMSSILAESSTQSSKHWYDNSLTNVIIKICQQEFKWTKAQFDVIQNEIQIKMTKAQLLNSKIKFTFKTSKIKLATILREIITDQVEWQISEQWWMMMLRVMSLRVFNALKRVKSESMNIQSSSSVAKREASVVISSVMTMKFFNSQLLVLFELLILKVWAYKQRTMFHTKEVARQSVKKLSQLIYLDYQRFQMIINEQLHSKKNDLIWMKWEKVLTSIFNEMFWRVVIKSSHQNDCRKIIFTVQLQKQTASSQFSILNFNQENMIVFDEEKQLN